jgi:hypothetical protein
MAAVGELYRTNWATSALATNKDYRIEIWGIAFSADLQKARLDPRWLFGWRDIRNTAGTAPNCSGAAPFCLIRFGSTIPVTVRIEQFVFCPDKKNCAVQFVADGQNANLEAQLGPSAAAPSAQLFIPGQSGTNFALAFEACSAAEDAAVSAAIDVPTFGPCVKTETLFQAALGTPAIISLCDHLDPTGFGLTHSQEEQLALHHFSDDLSRVQALPEAWQCTTPTSGLAAAVPNSALQLAQAVRDKVWSWFAPRPLFATALIDRGGGGQTSNIASFFKLGLPSKFEYVAPGDASQPGQAGTPLVLQAKVTDLLGDPVMNARVRWRAAVPPNDGATVLGVAPPGAILTNASGIAQQTVQLASAPGFNVFHAFGRGIADTRANGCTLPPGTPAACNGPRSIFDPFLPKHVPEFDDLGPELPITIAEGTRLLFRVAAERSATARP